MTTFSSHSVPLPKFIRQNINTIQRYRIRWMVLIATAWTLIDVLSKIAFTAAGRSPGKMLRLLTVESLTLRTGIVFGVSLIVSYLLVFRFRGMFRGHSLGRNFLQKTIILLGFAMLGNFLIHVTYTLFILGFGPMTALKAFWIESTTSSYLVEKTVAWMITFALTILVIEINEKYSPGLFFSIIFGSYANPRIERRIVMFLDLKDSTPTAEKLGTAAYFLFIRDFIYNISAAILEHDGRIYQYVGDEVVTSWPSSPASARKCLAALADARAFVRRSRAGFIKKYGMVPQFRVGIHEGEVTVGEIGLVKKDLAMSGDTMNTAARIRSATGEMDHDVLVSDALTRLLTREEKSIFTSVGKIELKGKSDELELFTAAWDALVPEAGQAARARGVVRQW